MEESVEFRVRIVPHLVMAAVAIGFIAFPMSGIMRDHSHSIRGSWLAHVPPWVFYSLAAFILLMLVRVVIRGPARVERTGFFFPGLRSPFVSWDDLESVELLADVYRKKKYQGKAYSVGRRTGKPIRLRTTGLRDPDGFHEALRSFAPQSVKLRNFNNPQSVQWFG